MDVITLEAKFIYMIFHNEDNDYTVAKFITYDQKEEEFTVTGTFHELTQDTCYRLHGEYKEHERYGMQFQAFGYEALLPNDKSSLIRYFSSSIFPGIGKKTATAIVSTLGEDCIHSIASDPSVLDAILSLNEKRKAIIIQGIKEYGALDQSILFFSQLGISVQQIAKIEAAYGKEALTMVKENPYQMIEDIDGIGFQTADKIAKELLFETDHPYRIKAAVLSGIMNICMANGDTFVNKRLLQNELNKKFNIHVESLETYLSELAGDCLIICEDDRIYHTTLYESERGIASFLAAFPFVDSIYALSSDFMQRLQLLEEQFHITYEQKQKEAIRCFFDSPFSIITGGPGTGKTTIVQGILALYQHYYPNDTVRLCAPTGRASKRLTQLSEGNATTIHSLLKWDLDTNTFMINESEPIAADVLIIDEFSMVDQWLFYNLLLASHSLKKILIIGDEDQLPSVGPGSVLKDLIETNQFPFIRLDKIFRQQEGSDVVTLAYEMKENHVDVLEHAKDIAFFECQNYEIRNQVNKIVANALDKGYAPQDIQVLAPMYQGVAGIDAMNNALQQMINPPQEHLRELRVGYRIFREADKVLQLKNQPDDQVSNGDIGFIEEIIYASEDIQGRNRIMIRFDDHVVEYSGEALYRITHAYCISIHKSQGSEYPIVIMPIVKDYRFMLQKRLLYTGITRAKKSLVLLGDKALFYKAIQTMEHHVRKSTLKQRILTYME